MLVGTWRPRAFSSDHAPPAPQNAFPRAGEGSRLLIPLQAPRQRLQRYTILIRHDQCFSRCNRPPILHRTTNSVTDH